MYRAPALRLSHGRGSSTRPPTPRSQLPPSPRTRAVHDELALRGNGFLLDRGLRDGRELRDGRPHGLGRIGAHRHGDTRRGHPGDDRAGAHDRGASGRDNAGSAARVNARAHPGDARGETAHGERGGHRLELDRSISDTCASIAIRGTLCGPWRTSPVSWSALAGRSARRQVGLHFCGFSRQEGVSAVPCETERSQSRDF